MSRTRVRDCEGVYNPDDRLLHQYDAVRRFLESLCDDGDLAEDLAQQTYLRAYAHLARHDRKIDSPRSWLFTVARCAYVDHVRYRAVRPQTNPESLDAIADPRSERSREAAEVREEVSQLSRAIEALDPLSRDLLIGYHVDGERLKDLAARHRLTPTAARVRVWRARRRLPGERG